MKKQGFTLVEVILSLAIVSILIVAIFSMIFSIIKNTKLNTDKQKARLIAQETIEQIRASKDMADTLPNGVMINMDMNTKTGSISGNLDGFTVEGDIKFKADGEDEDAKFLEKKVGALIDLNREGYLYSSNTTLKEYTSTSPLGIRTSISKLDIKLESSYLYIDNAPRSLVDSKDLIVIYIKEDLSEDAVNISIDNKDDSKNNIYFVSEPNIDLEKCYEIDYLRGKFSIYNKKIYLNRKQEGIYSIELKIIKDHIVLQTVNAQKTIR